MKNENRINELIKTSGKTIKEISEATGINYSSLSAYSSKDRTPGKSETWEKLAKYFNTSPPYLMGLDNNKITYQEWHESITKELGNERFNKVIDIGKKLGEKYPDLTPKEMYEKGAKEQEIIERKKDEIIKYLNEYDNRYSYDNIEDWKYSVDNKDIEAIYNVMISLKDKSTETIEWINKLQKSEIQRKSLEKTNEMLEEKIKQTNKK